MVGKSFTTFCILPPSVVMSQKTFKGLPLFSGSIQYSPSFKETPESLISLQEYRTGLWEYEYFLAITENAIFSYYIFCSGTYIYLHYQACDYVIKLSESARARAGAS